MKRSEDASTLLNNAPTSFPRKEEGESLVSPGLKYKGSNFMSTSAFQTMTEEIVRQR